LVATFVCIEISQNKAASKFFFQDYFATLSFFPRLLAIFLDYHRICNKFEFELIEFFAVS